MKTQSRLSGFTLIELLIVVAIIAILAAIAVPNFLEAQVRAKVARVKSDERTLATALEVYHTDNNSYPDMMLRFLVITTPISYLTSIPKDAFRLQEASGAGFSQRGSYRYGAMPLDGASRYALASNGPDTDIDSYYQDAQDTDTGSGGDSTWVATNSGLRYYPGYKPELFSTGVVVESAKFRYVQYDATNGTVSDGDIFRLSDYGAK